MINQIAARLFCLETALLLFSCQGQDESIRSTDEISSEALTTLEYAGFSTKEALLYNGYLFLEEIWELKSLNWPVLDNRAWFERQGYGIINRAELKDKNNKHEIHFPRYV